MKEMKMSPWLICGSGGIVGFLFTSFVIMPISYFIKSPEGNGLHENIIDSFKMMYNSILILVLEIFYLISTALYSITG
jgi:hypothetical protein